MSNKKDIKFSDVFSDVFVGDLIYTVTRHILALTIALVIVGFTLFNYVFSLSVGHSMHPSVPDNSIVISKQINENIELKRGDIIIFKAPEENDGVYTKRIIGEPSEIVDIRSNGVYVNNKRIEETYTEGLTFGQAAKFSMNYKVDKNAYYVLGDNREHSMDSRDFGTIKKEKIIGKVIYVIPIGEFIMKLKNI